MLGLRGRTNQIWQQSRLAGLTYVRSAVPVPASARALCPLSSGRYYSAEAAEGDAAPAADQPLEKPDYKDKTVKKLPEDWDKDWKDDPSKWKTVTNWDEYQFDPRVKQVAEQVLSLDMVGQMELIKLMQMRMNISDETIKAWESGGGGGGGGGGGAAQPAAAAEAEAAPEEAKATKRNVILVGMTDGAKVKIMKELRAFNKDLKLTQVKEMVTSLPSPLAENLELEQAEELKKRFEEVGAQVELKE